MASTPNFVASANIGFARPTGVNGASDGSGVLGSTIFDLVTAAAGGTRVDRITIRASSNNGSAASTACVIRFFLTDHLGTNPRIFNEILIPAGTKSNTAVSANTGGISFPGGLLLKSGQKIQVCQSVYGANTTQFDIVAYGGNL